MLPGPGQALQRKQRFQLFSASLWASFACLMCPLSVKPQKLLNSLKELFGEVMNWITQTELLRGLKRNRVYLLSAVPGKLTEVCLRGIMSFMSQALTPTGGGGGGGGAGSTSSRPLTAQILFHDRSCCSGSDYLWAYRRCTDRHELFYTGCRRQQSCCDPEGRAAEESAPWAAVNPPTLPGSVRVITPASNELLSRSRCTLESNQEAHEAPNASWSSSFFPTSSHTFPELFCI